MEIRNELRLFASYHVVMSRTCQSIGHSVELVANHYSPAGSVSYSKILQMYGARAKIVSLVTISELPRQNRN